MKRSIIPVLALTFIVTGVLHSCKKDKVEEPNEEEIITTLEVELTDNSNGVKTTFKFDDADGPGGNAPVQDTIRMSPAKTYTVKLTMLNKTANPPEDITEEVEEEADDHEIFIEPAAGSNLVVSNRNLAGNLNLPLGITSTWASGSAVIGSVKITLKHKPGAKAAGDAVSKGDTDIEVVFNTKVQ
jgi:cell division septation protein DedD